MELISREDAVEAIEELKNRYLDRKVILAKAQDAVNNLPTAERVENIPFGELKAICRYYTLSYDAGKGVESACHSTANMKDGESWGKCNEHDCPFWKDTENE